ncbi:MAG TPA: hypothetical protein VMS54_07850 [Vicinamibacterales bacterium]|nr:hypothetical protein [Vicinamibacterales bacterium]
MQRMIKTGFVLAAIIAVVGLWQGVEASKAKTAGSVEYTWTLAALGQGGWIGGPLFEDGSVGGGGAFSSGNGSVIALLKGTTWSENDAEEITVCFDIIQKKGTGLPSSLCIGPAEVTGTPIRIEFLGGPHVFRITENHPTVQ